MQYTTNLNLAKPDATDDADIAVLNQNADKIDLELQKLNSIPDKATSAEALAGMDDVKYLTPAKSKHTLNPILSAAPWVKIASYETAGSYSWIVPDLFIGEQYDVGVMIIGAGGGGNSHVTSGSTSNSRCASGGASGYSNYRIMKVTPNQSYNLIVGKGGSGGGGNGGTSSFNGEIVKGGEGGKLNYGDILSTPSLGGMTASASNPNGRYGGESAQIFNNYNLAPDYLSCFNPFEYKRILGSGGGGGLSYSNNTTYNTYVGNGGKDLKSGLGGGNGAASVGSDVVAQNATEAGCGGGGALTWRGTSAIAGNGADGAVYIYARKAVS